MYSIRDVLDSLELFNTCSCISDSGDKSSGPNGTIVIGGKTVIHNGTVVPITTPLQVDSSTKAYMDDDKTRKQVGQTALLLQILETSMMRKNEAF